MPTLGSLVAGLTPITSRRKADVYLVELDSKDEPVKNPDGMPNYRRFQYFPESISDTKAVNYATKEIPGASLPLYQWVNSGARALSFTAVFATDVDHTRDIDDSGSLPALPGPSPISAFQERLSASGVEEHNAYVPAALLWLRRFMLPTYKEESGVGTPLTQPPAKLELVFPAQSRIENMGGDAGGASGIVCVMTACDITYEAFFPSGNIRIATVQLNFAQVPQRGGTVTFPQAGEEVPEEQRYRFETRNMRPDTKLSDLI